MGIGSSYYHLAGQTLVILQVVSSFTGPKALKARGAKVGASVAEPEVGNMS